MPYPIPEPREYGYTTNTPVPLYWAAYGLEGAPRLLVLHGGPGADHRYLLPQMLRLADHYDLRFYDQRGGGQSTVLSTDRTPITWRTQVDDLAGLIREMWGTEPPTIVGYSWGGLLALLYATSDRGYRPPERMVLLDPAAINHEFRDDFEQEFARRQATPAVTSARATLSASGLRDRDMDTYRQRAFELSVVGYFANPTLAERLTPFRVTGRVQQSVWTSLGEYDLVPALQSLRARQQIPTLIVHGRQDPIPLASSEAAAAALQAELVVLDDCGHVPYVEQPEKTFSAIERFLAATPSAVPPIAPTLRAPDA